MQPKHYAIIASIIFFLVITIQNIGSVKIYFLFWDFSVSLVILLLIFLVLGGAAGFLAGHFMNRRGSSGPDGGAGR